MPSMTYSRQWLSQADSMMNQTWIGLGLGLGLGIELGIGLGLANQG